MKASDNGAAPFELKALQAGYLKALEAWLDEAEGRRPLDTAATEGLCDYIYAYLRHEVFDTFGEAAAAADLLTEAFEDRYPCAVFPFGRVEYLRMARQSRMHEDPNRLAFVRDEIDRLRALLQPVTQRE